MFSMACGSVWFIYCHLWKNDSCVPCVSIPFCVHRCVCVCVCAPICVFGTQMYLYTNCFDFIKLTSFHGNTSWPRRLLLGCHITRCRRAVPIICQSAYLLWYHGTYTHYIAVFLWELIESGLSGLNTGGSFMLGSACFSSSNSFTVYVRT